MNALIAAGAANALFLAVLVGARSGGRLPDRLLAFLLLGIGAAFGFAFGALEFGRDVLLLPLVYANLLYTPLYFLYAASLVRRGAIPRRYALHLVPFCVAVVHLLFLLVTRSENELNSLFASTPFRSSSLPFTIFWLADFVAPPAYVAAVLVALAGHGRRIRSHLSNIEHIDLVWLRRLSLVVLAMWLLIDVPLAIRPFAGALSENALLYAGFSLSTFCVFYLGFHGWKQLGVPVNATPEVAGGVGAGGERYARSGLSSRDADVLKERLLSFMDSQRPHLNESLSLSDLADALEVSEHNLSEVINVGLGRNFYDFVNGYRIDEFKKQASDPRNGHLTLLAVAMECGFNSKSSFNRIVKQHTGLTPSALARSGTPAQDDPAARGA